MRGSGWLLAVVPVAAWLVCVCVPILALLTHVVGSPATDVDSRPVWNLLFTSVGWAIAVTIGASLVGWVPGRLLGRALGRRGFVVLAMLLLTPVCLPSYIVFFAWWQSWPADSAFHRWVIAHDLMPLARQATLYIGLVCWSWPLVSWCVAGAVAAVPAEHDELLSLDGAGPAARCAEAIRSDSRGLFLGALLVFLATLNNTTCFDLAEVFTFANELRAVEALGAGPRQLLITSAPMTLLVVVGALLMWTATAARPTHAPTRTARPRGGVIVASGGLWFVSVAVPLALFAANVGGGDGMWPAICEFIQLYRFSAINTIALAGLSGLIASIIAIGFFAAWLDHRRWVKRAADAAGVSWLILALAPGTMIGIALEAAYNHPSLAGTIYSNPLILIVGHLASFGFVAVLVGRWLALSEPRQLRDLRRLDGAHTLSGLLSSNRPRLLGGCMAVLAIVFVLSVGEIPVTAKVNPPLRAGHGPLALTLLNDMHYQRPQTVMVAAIGMMAVALGAAAIIAVVWRGLQSYRLPTR